MGSQAGLSIAEVLIADVVVVVTIVIAVVDPAVAKIVWEDISIFASGGRGWASAPLPRKLASSSSPSCLFWRAEADILEPTSLSSSGLCGNLGAFA